MDGFYFSNEFWSIIARLCSVTIFSFRKFGTANSRQQILLLLPMFSFVFQTCTCSFSVDDGRPSFFGAGRVFTGLLNLLRLKCSATASSQRSKQLRRIHVIFWNGRVPAFKALAGFGRYPKTSRINFRYYWRAHVQPRRLHKSGSKERYSSCRVSPKFHFHASQISKK